MGKSLLLFLHLIVITNCGKSTPIDGCDKIHGRFLRGKHYIPANLLNDDHQWNYKKMQRKIKFGLNGDCVPIHKEPQIADVIDQLEEIVDLQ